MLDLEGRIKFANASLLVLIGRSENDAFNVPLASFIFEPDVGDFCEAMTALRSGEMDDTVVECRFTPHNSEPAFSSFRPHSPTASLVYDSNFPAPLSSSLLAEPSDPCVPAVKFSAMLDRQQERIFLCGIQVTARRAQLHLVSSVTSRSYSNVEEMIYTNLQVGAQLSGLKVGFVAQFVPRDFPVTQLPESEEDQERLSFTARSPILLTELPGKGDFDCSDNLHISGTFVDAAYPSSGLQGLKVRRVYPIADTHCRRVFDNFRHSASHSVSANANDDGHQMHTNTTEVTPSPSPQNQRQNVQCGRPRRSSSDHLDSNSGSDRDCAGSDDADSHVHSLASVDAAPSPSPSPFLDRSRSSHLRSSAICAIFPSHLIPSPITLPLFLNNKLWGVMSFVMCVPKTDSDHTAVSALPRRHFCDHHRRELLHYIACNVSSHLAYHVEKLHRMQLEETHNAIFRLTAIFLAIFSLDGQFLELNPTFNAVLGLDSEMHNESWYKFMHPDDVDATARELSSFLHRGNDSAGHILQLSNRFRVSEKKGGGYRTIDWKAVLDRDQKKLVAVGRDITDDLSKHAMLEEAKRIAEDAASMKGNFLANMSHEIRSVCPTFLHFSSLGFYLCSSPLLSHSLLSPLLLSRAAQTALVIVRQQHPSF